MPDRTHQINPSCTACQLHKGCKTVCMKDKNADGRRKLMIFTDYPDYVSDAARRPYFTDTGEILNWMLERMSVNSKEVAYGYTLRCQSTKTEPSKKADRAAVIVECNQYRFASIAKCKPKAIVALGNTSLEAFTGKSKAGDYQGRTVKAWEGVVRDYVEHVWVGYSLQYILFQGVTETPNTFRTIFKAAKEAGLNPKLNPEIKPFKWKTVM